MIYDFLYCKHIVTYIYVIFFCHIKLSVAGYCADERLNLFFLTV